MFTAWAQDPVLSSREISSCDRSCIFQDSLLSHSFDSGIMVLEFSAILNCSFNSKNEITIKVTGDSLLIHCEEYIQHNSDPVPEPELLSVDTIYNIKGDQVIDVVKMFQYFEKDYSVEVSMCDCIFHFELEVQNLFLDPKFIYVNGRMLR